MSAKMVVSLLFAALVAAPAVAGRPSVRIDAPRHGDTVEARHPVTGTVSGSPADVWVIIRPRATRDYWVQAPVSVDEDGSWRVIGCFGEPGRDFGARYEVRAVVGPSMKLREGLVLRGWPRAAASSSIHVVTRR